MRKKINFRHSKKNYSSKLNRNSNVKIHPRYEIKPQNYDATEKKPIRKQSFLLNFVKAFNFGFERKKRVKLNDVKDYFNIVVNDINLSFEKIKYSYERKRN